MKIMTWNCRGAASVPFGRTLREMVTQYKAEVVILLETRCSGEAIPHIIRRMNFKNFIIEEAHGFAGGIWIMWNRDDISINVLKKHQQFIHAEIAISNNDPWFLTAVYACPQENGRKELWQELKTIAMTMQKCWMIMGDFNEIAESSEKKGGAPVDMAKCRAFSARINDCNLIDLGFIGSRFTWRGPLWNGKDRVFKRLDRALANVDWRIRYSEATILTLPRVASDHHPIIINLDAHIENPSNRPFRFEATWLQHLDFPLFVQTNWNQNAPFTDAISDITMKLKDWNREVFGNLFRKKRRLLNRIEGI